MSDEQQQPKPPLPTRKRIVLAITIGFALVAAAIGTVVIGSNVLVVLGSGPESMALDWQSLVFIGALWAFGTGAALWLTRGARGSITANKRGIDLDLQIEA